MRIRLIAWFIAWLVPAVSAAPPPISWLQNESDCAGFSTDAGTICRRIVASRKYLDALHPKLLADERGVVRQRQLVILAWDGQGAYHPIWLAMPVRPKPGEKFPVSVLTRGYTVEHVRGSSPYKLEFHITREGEKLLVFGGKHVWIPGEYRKETSLRKLSRVIEERQYLPFLEHLYHPELVSRGRLYVESLIDTAGIELGRVPSRAFPGLSLARAYPKEVLLGLIISEQTDPYKLFHGKTPPLLPRESYLLGVLIEIAMHGPHAFAGLCSRASACDLMQFTNKPVKNYPGTYTYTYRMCKSPEGHDLIDRNFVRGASDTINAIKAAVCYLDLEKATLPQEARDEYLKDPKHGSIYMLAAYNGGGGVSKSLYKKISQLRSHHRNEHLIYDHSSLPKSLFPSGKNNDYETYWYIKKYLWAWDLLTETSITALASQ